MIDLCDRRLGTTVRASALDDDVHVINNLISTDPHKRDTGYKPALYIGGIIAVDVIFPFPVTLYTVQFTTATSKPTQAQVWVSQNIPAVTKTTRPFPMSLISTCPLSPTSSTIILSSSSTLSSHHLPRDTPILPLSESRDTRACQCVRIVVQTMGQDRCLRGLRIFGGVGVLSRAYLNRENITRKDIEKLVEDVKDKIKKEKSQQERKTRIIPHCSLLQTKSETSHSESTTSTTSIPEEFLDAITRHVMACPVILPSGNVVDSSTVDKHTAAELKWGRESSDPFTGMPFSAECRPIHHTTLTERIDKWREECGGGVGTPPAGVGSPHSGRCVGVAASSSGVSLSEQILNKQAKRMRVDEDKYSQTRRKRLKKFQQPCNPTTPPNVTSNTETTLHSQTDATGLSKYQRSNSNDNNNTEVVRVDSNSTVTLDSNSTVTLDSNEGNSELSSVERTLQLIARHEERLELF